MKTIYTLLIALMIMPATLSTISAQDNENRRSERVKTERKATTRTAAKRETEKKVNTREASRKVETQRKAVAEKQEKRESDRNVVAQRKSIEENRKKIDESRARDSREPERKSNIEISRNTSTNNDIYRNGEGRNGNSSDKGKIESRDNDNSRSQIESRNNGQNRSQVENRNNNNDRNRSQVENRNNGQSREPGRNDGRNYGPNSNRNRVSFPIYDRKSDRRFRNDNERCRVCFGVGYSFSHDRIHRIRCHSCYGRGFHIGFGHNIREFCPICFTRIFIGGISHQRSIEEIARMETNHLSVTLNLSDRQARKIYRINVNYLRDRRYDSDYAMQRRDKDILDVLNRRQQEIYLDMIYDVDYRDLCDQCFERR